MEDIRCIRQILMAKAAGLVATICTYMIFIMRRARQRTPEISYGPLMERDKIRQTNLRFIYDSNDTNFVNQLRMRRAPFFRLCHLLRQREKLRDSIHSSVEEQVTMFLLVVGHNVRFRALQPIFRRSTETISRYFGEVLYAIGELRNDLIKPPSTDIPRKILANNRFNPYFKDCIGAIDGTHVLARVPSAMSAAFRGRKGVTATGRFAMGSNEALGAPADMADSGLGVMDGDMEGGKGVGAGCASVAGGTGAGPVGGNFIPAVNDIAGGSSSSGKRKRTPVVTEEEGAFLTNMTGAMHEVAAAIRSTGHTEVHPELHNAVMDLPGFTEDQLDLVLDHLTADKSASLTYIQKKEVRRARWVTKFLAKHHPDCI